MTILRTIDKGPNVMSDFWGRVDRSGGEGACWPWLGARNSTGYGRLRRDNKDYTAHRFAAFLSGILPDLAPQHDRRNGLVLHSCDNPACCNPAHLRLGSQVENVADAVARDRRRYAPCYGTTSYRAKLTDELVLAIRAEYAAGGESHATLSKKYGIHRSAIGRIITRHRWGWL